MLKVGQKVERNSRKISLLYLVSMGSKDRRQNVQRGIDKVKTLRNKGNLGSLFYLEIKFYMEDIDKGVILEAYLYE